MAAYFHDWAVFGTKKMERIKRRNLESDAAF